MQFSRPSDTAMLIARCTLLAAHDPRRKALVPAKAATMLTCLPPFNCGWFGFSLSRKWTHPIFRAAEHVMLPGISNHYLSRKLWIEKHAREAIDRGTLQVVVLGAGFDTLCARLCHEYPGVRFFELDHTATQAPKQSSLPHVANLTFIPVDLTARSPAAILRHTSSFTVDHNTLFIAEGLFMYFPESRVTAILSELTSLTRISAGIIFSFMELADNGSPGFRQRSTLVNGWLRWRREPFLWGISRSALPVFVRSCGLRVATLADHETLRAEILTPLHLSILPLPQGECLCHCTPS